MRWARATISRPRPIQLINAYSALVNGGHLFTPRIGHASGFVPKLQTDIAINAEHRALILKGMRGAVRYGTAETAGLYSLPIYTFGKTGTATEINGFRMQGWFVGFASALPDGSNVWTRRGRWRPARIAPESAELAVLVFLSRGHGSEAAEVARPIFAEYASDVQRHGDRETRRHGEGRSRDAGLEAFAASQRPRVSASRHSRRLSYAFTSVRENITRTMSLEDYVRGVVAAEGSTETEVEALKALAIASRTYALKNIHRHARDGYDFCTTTHCQRYRHLNLDSTVSISALSPKLSRRPKAKCCLAVTRVSLILISAPRAVAQRRILRRSGAESRRLI